MFNIKLLITFTFAFLQRTRQSKMNDNNPYDIIAPGQVEQNIFNTDNGYSNHNQIRQRRSDDFINLRADQFPIILLSDDKTKKKGNQAQVKKHKRLSKKINKLREHGGSGTKIKKLRINFNTFKNGLQLFDTLRDWF